MLRTLPSSQRDAIAASWPGPNTWLVPHRGVFPPWVTGNSDEVAIRVTSSPPWPPCAGLWWAFDLYQRQSGRAGASAPNVGVRRHFGTALPCMPGAIDAAGKPSTIRRASDGTVIRV